MVIIPKFDNTRNSFDGIVGAVVERVAAAICVGGSIPARNKNLIAY